MKVIKFSLFASAAAVAIASGGQAHAQDEATTLEEGLADIVVTAQRRAALLQDTPLAVTAVTSEQLEKETVTSVRDLQGLAPGVVFVGDTQPAVRGVSNNAVVSTTVESDTSVSIFIDGIVNTRSQIGLLYDVNRVEVLRGPQGTLYGRNNTGGAVNIFNNVPVDYFEARLSVEGGNYERFSLEGMVNLPVSEKVAVRAAFMTVQHDAYQDNGYGTQDDKAGRIRLNLKPTDSTNILLGVDYEENSGKPTTPSVNPPGAFPVGPLPFDPWAGIPLCQNGEWVPFGGCVGDDGYSDNSVLSFIAQLDQDLGFANLTYLGGYRDVNNDFRIYSGLGGEAQQNFRTDNRTQSHELRLANADESAIKWVAGLYYLEEKVDSFLRQGPWPTFYPNLFINHVESSPSKSRSWAAFAQVTVPLSERFRVTGGIRYTKDKKNARQIIYFTPGPSLNEPAPPGTPVFDLLYKDSKVSYKIGVEFDIADDVLAYLDYSTGYKAGGFFSAFPPGNTFEPENIKAIQGGIKSRLFNNSVQLNVDGFYYDYSDLQVQSLLLLNLGPLPDSPPSLGAGTVNSEKARFYGAEAETVIALSRNDRISANVSWLDATLTKMTIAGFTGPVVLDGFEAPYSPDLSGRVQYTRTFRLSGGGRFEAQVNMDWSDGYWIQVEHAPGSYQKSYTRTGFNLTYYSSNDRWSIGIWARNLEKKSLIQQYYPSIPLTFPGVFPPVFTPTTTVTTDQPRVFGARVTANF